MSGAGTGHSRLRPDAWSLASQLFAIQALVILVVLIGSAVAGYSHASATNSAAAQDEVLGVAHAVAATPTVREGLAEPIRAPCCSPSPSRSAGTPAPTSWSS